jgi:hypothetical protein
MTYKSSTQEETPTETDIVGPAGPAVPTELSSSHRLTNGLAFQWEKDAQLLAQYGSPQQADVLRHCSQKLFEVIKSEKEVLLTLTLASQVSGYSADHLGRMVGDGKLTNYGRKGSPKLRLGDLPKKPRAVVADMSAKYDADTDARSLLARGRRVL